MKTSDPLEIWVDESIRRSEAKAYHPSDFIGMRTLHGTVGAMERLVESGQIQSGFIRLKKLNMAKDWSVEAGILKFAERFSQTARECAQFRLDHIDDKELR